VGRAAQAFYIPATERSTRLALAAAHPLTFAKGSLPPAPNGLKKMDLPGFSEMESEKACDYNDHYDYADDVKDIHRSAPIEECTTSARPVSVPWMKRHRWQEWKTKLVLL
jgi:hypothetical protein